MAYIQLEKLINLYNGYRRTFSVGGLKLLLIQDNNKHYLIAAMCPHMDWPLQSSSIINDEIICSKHGYAFNLFTGKIINRQAHCNPLSVYKLAYEGAGIGVLMANDAQ